MNLWPSKHNYRFLEAMTPSGQEQQLDQDLGM
jgi:hypothetical protein